MRRGFGLVGLLATIIFVVIVGAIAYNIGWSDGVNTHLPAATNDGTVAPYYYGHFGGPGFGFFGIFWFLLILFGIFWLFRIAFWGFGARRFWGGGWYGRGWGYGPGGQGPQGMPRKFDEMAQEWHRKQHGEQPPAGSTPPPPPTDTRSV